MPVMKFGGSSVANAEKIRKVADIIISRLNEEKTPPVVVVSAMKGVTNLLLSSALLAESGDNSYRGSLEELETTHINAAEELIENADELAAMINTVKSMVEELGDILHGVQLVRECSPRTTDLISGFGERLSSPLLASHIRSRGSSAIAVDARNLIRTDNTHGRAKVDFATTEKLTKAALGKRESVAVVTGFIASTADGVGTTLGRNGSDYTASILGASLNAASVEVWTDVDGILTADPRVYPGARIISELSFQEAMELSYFGAEVIHPFTLVPVIEKNIPVYIKNTMNPSAAGTRITKTASPKTSAITGIAAIDEVAMVTIEGGGMVGMPGVAGRIFASVAGAGVNIIMISQASSEHSICLVCRTDEARKAKKVLENDLSDVIAAQVIRKIEVLEGLETVAVIGDNMRGQVGLSGKLFSALGDKGVNILAIAQGSSELNISFVIKNSDKVAAITAIHRAFLG